MLHPCYHIPTNNLKPSVPLGFCCSCTKIITLNESSSPYSLYMHPGCWAPIKQSQSWLASIQDLWSPPCDRIYQSLHSFFFLSLLCSAFLLPSQNPGDVYYGIFSSTPRGSLLALFHKWANITSHLLTVTHFSIPYLPTESHIHSFLSKSNIPFQYSNISSVLTTLPGALTTVNLASRPTSLDLIENS